RATNDAVWDWDLVTDSLWWSDGIETLFGIARDEIATIRAWEAAIHPEDREQVTVSLGEALRGEGNSWKSEYRFRRKDGVYAHVLDRGHVMRGERGEPVRMIGGLADLTAHKATGERLAEQAALLEKARDAILVRDLDHRITYWNSSAERLYGWSREEAAGARVDGLLYRDTRDFEAATAHVIACGEWVGE